MALSYVQTALKERCSEYEQQDLFALVCDLLEQNVITDDVASEILTRCGVDIR